MEKIILYSRNGRGDILEWSIEVVPYNQVGGLEGTSNDNSSVIVIYEGLLEGKKTETTNLVSKGKNTGKMNETTPYQQAVKQALSRVEKKLKQGYKSLIDLGLGDSTSLEKYTSINEAVEAVLPKTRTDANNLSKCMKAMPYYKIKTTNGIKTKTNEPLIKFPCFGQPKLNGFRVFCRWEKVTLEQGTVFEQETYKPVFRSKEGLRYDILEHIADEMTEDMFKWNINGQEIELVFDGEMYIHREILSEIASAVKKRGEKTSLLKFWIFDLAIEDLRQDERLRILDEIHTNIIHKNIKNLGVVTTTEILTNEQAQEFTNLKIEEGYEGAIFRDKKAKYGFGKRVSTMTKLKRSIDKEYTIINVIGGENSPELGMFVCKTSEGLEFTVNPEGSHEKKKEYLLNKNNYIGKPLTVKFFEYTKDGKPFHATGVAIRDYE